MRSCPHCGEPIQDEAVLCKHCHQEVEPPLWTNSMRRCPYCAEWIDLENENCKFCGQHVGSVDLTESSEFLDSLLSEDLSGLSPAEASESGGLPKQSPFVEQDAGDASDSPQPSSEQREGFDFEPDSPFERIEPEDPDRDPSELERELSKLEQELGFLGDGEADRADDQSFGEREPLDFGRRPEERPEPLPFGTEPEEPAKDRPWWGSETVEDPDYRSLAESKQAGNADRQPTEPSAPADEPEEFERQTPEFSRDLRRSLLGVGAEPEPEAEEPVESEQSLSDESERNREPEQPLGFESQADEQLDRRDEPEQAPRYERSQWDQEPEYTDESEQPVQYGSAWGDEETYDEQPDRSQYYESDWSEEPAESSSHYYSPEPEPLETGSSAADFEAQSSIWVSEVEPEEQASDEQPAVEVSRRALPLAILQGLIVVGLIGGLGYLAVTLARGPVGARLAEALATDIPTETPIPGPTATLRSASILPPATSVAPDPTETGGSTTGGCLRWDQITLEHEGEELCVYGIIRRWFAVSDVPFVGVFSEESGTFVVIDRTTTHEAIQGDCVVARGAVEIMSRTRPDIDVNGTLESCPEDWLLPPTPTPAPTPTEGS